MLHLRRRHYVSTSTSIKNYYLFIDIFPRLHQETVISVAPQATTVFSFGFFLWGEFLYRFTSLHLIEPNGHYAPWQKIGIV